MPASKREVTTFSLGYDCTEAEMRVIADVLDDAEMGFVNQLDQIHIEANRGEGFGSLVLGIAAKLEVERYLDPDQFVVPCEPELSVDDIETTWLELDLRAAAHLRAVGDHKTAEFINS